MKNWKTEALAATQMEGQVHNIKTRQKILLCGCKNSWKCTQPILGVTSISASCRIHCYRWQSFCFQNQLYIIWDTPIESILFHAIKINVIATRFTGWNQNTDHWSQTALEGAAKLAEELGHCSLAERYREDAFKFLRHEELFSIAQGVSHQLLHGWLSASKRIHARCLCWHYWQQYQHRSVVRPTPTQVCPGNSPTQVVAISIPTQVCRSDNTNTGFSWDQHQDRLVGVTTPTQVCRDQCFFFSRSIG